MITKSNHKQKMVRKQAVFMNGVGEERISNSQPEDLRLDILKCSLGCARHRVTMVDKMAFAKFMIWGWRQTKEINTP